MRKEQCLGFWQSEGYFQTVSSVVVVPQLVNTKNRRRWKQGKQEKSDGKKLEKGLEDETEQEGKQ